MLITINLKDLSDDYKESALYKNIDHDEETISVPIIEYYSKKTIDSKEDLRLIIKSIMYWGFDKVPEMLMKFVCINNLIDLPDVPDFKKTFYYEHLIIVQKWNVELAALKGLLHPMKFLLDAGFRKGKMIEYAASNGHLDCLKCAYDYNCECDNSIIEETVRNGHLDCLIYLHKTGFRFTINLTRYAIINGHLDCLKYLLEQNCYLCLNIFTIASQNGQLICLKFLHEYQKTHSFPQWDEFTCQYAAEKGHLDCLKYLHENGCPWNSWTCQYAAENGHLDCLKYAHENGCSLTMNCDTVARNGHLNCLRYLHENGCHWDETTCIYAAMKGKLECLKYAHENGCYWNKETCEHAAYYGHLDCLKYAHEQGCPWDIRTYYFAIRKNYSKVNTDCAKYYYKETWPLLYYLRHYHF